MSKGIFITGTDTDVGKTIATAVIGVLIQEKGMDVGVMKPVQCGGSDAEALKNILKLDDTVEEINPYFVKEPLAPHLAFARQKKSININKIVKGYEALKVRHDVTLVEGAGGLMVPLKHNYLMVDLIKDLDLDIIIVSRLGLGTINHTLLTIHQACSLGLNVRGIIFSQNEKGALGVAEQTNPEAIKKFGQVSILGIVPYLKNINRAEIIKKCRKEINLKNLLSQNKTKTWQYIQEDKEYVWHPFTQMQDWLQEEPLIVDKAKGSYLIDTEGKKYLDGVSSLWVNVHGHGKKAIDEALKQQINKLGHSTLLGLSNTPAIDLAKQLVDISPRGLEKVFYSDSGSTAVEIAIKMAYQYWQNIGKKQKRNVVHLANSYHGDTLGSVSVGGIDLFHKVYKGLIFKTIQLDFPDCYRLPKGKKYPEYAFECLERLEVLLKKQADTIAAFIVEPIVQGAAGMIMHPKGILRRMAELCQQYDIVFIVDEVATGFGRTGKMFACEHENVRPDILCMAKGITGGYLPLAATLTTQKIFEGFCFDYKKMKTFFHGHTYTGNPLACAAALANLEVFRKENTLKKLQPKIKFLQKELQRFYDIPAVGDVRQRGFMVGIELVENKETKKAFSWEKQIGVKVCRHARKYGVILRPLGNVIVLMPPLSISLKELKRLLEVTYVAIEEVVND